MPNAIEQIYQELTQIFSSLNPNQIFHINISNPQILGWFLELTTKDLSQKISKNVSDDSGRNEETIFQFIKVLENISKDSNDKKVGNLTNHPVC